MLGIRVTKSIASEIDKAARKAKVGRNEMVREWLQNESKRRRL